MVVYIEYAVLDNLIIDYLIVYLTSMVTHVKYTKWNITLALLEGVVFAIVTPLIVLNTYLMVIIKILYSILMVVSLHKYSNVKQFVVHYVLFLSFTFVLGGVRYALLNLFSIPYNSQGLLLNGFAVPISIIILLAFAYVYIMIKLIKYLSKQNNALPYYYDVVLTINGKEHFVRGYLDSGNKLYDNVDGKPVVVLSFTAFCKIFKGFPFQKLLLSNVNTDDLTGAHYIRVDSVGATQNMLVFDGDGISVSGQEIKVDKQNVRIGVSTKNFGGEFECLLHNDLF